MRARADERAALLALLRLVGLDAPRLPDQLANHSAADLLAEQLVADGDQTRLLDTDPIPLIAAAGRELTAWARSGLRMLGERDEAYPSNLRLVHDRPAVLFAAGELGPWSQRSVAVVGTRNPSAEGLARTEKVVGELAAAGYVVISGLAAGVDTAAHRAAIAAGGRTVAVIGTGHMHAHPSGNRALQDAIAAEHAVVSPFWPETQPSPETFRRRNGVMSGMARATVIVEAGARSGTRVQARLALAHGRPVCLMEPVLDQEWAVELARRPGVHVVTSAAEVVAIAATPYDPAPPEDPE